MAVAAVAAVKGMAAAAVKGMAAVAKGMVAAARASVVVGGVMVGPQIRTRIEYHSKAW